MHYIRILRPPSITTLTAPKGQEVLNLVLNITTDLSDAYLSPPSPVELAVWIQIRSPPSSGARIEQGICLTHNNSPLWKAGMRVLKLQLPLPRAVRSKSLEARDGVGIFVQAVTRRYCAISTSDLLSTAQGRIMAAEVFWPVSGGDVSHIAFRELKLLASSRANSVMRPPGGSEGKRGEMLPDIASVGGVQGVLRIEEDFGESMARHVWDGGLVAVSWLAECCLASGLSPNDDGEQDPEKEGGGLRRAARSLLLSTEDLSILELGCGVGVLGSGLAHIMRSCARVSGMGRRHILMTDLPDAEERAQANVSHFRSSGNAEDTISLDYENLDWEDAKGGHYGAKLVSRPWDLVILSDCTYNTDTLTILMEALTSIHSHSAQDTFVPPKATKVILATKHRHSSEQEMFAIMSKAEWQIKHRVRLPLPVLGDELQLVEIFLYEKI